jgi:hypothetical protein
MIARRAASVLCLALTWAASCAPPTGAQEHSLAVREAAFLRTVDRHNTAYVVTGDLVRFTGTHVAYDCGIDSIVQKGLTLSDCGTEAEPMDLFVRMPTAGIHVGERVRVLGVIERPAQWTDLMGHTVYYAFLKALYVERRS